MNDETLFEQRMRRLRHASSDSPQDQLARSIAFSYEAGRRDGAAAIGRPLIRWRAVAGVLLAATLAIAWWSAGHTERPMRPVAAGEATHAEQEAYPVAAMRVLPESYVLLRQSALTGSDGDLPDPGERRSGETAGMRDQEPMTARDTL